MRTLRVFDTDYPILADLKDGWFLVAHRNGPAISTDQYQFLGSPAHPSEEVPEGVRTRAVNALMNWAKDQPSYPRTPDGL